MSKPTKQKKNNRWEVWLKADCGCIIYHKIGSPYKDKGIYKIKGDKKKCKVHNSIGRPKEHKLPEIKIKI